MLLHAITDPLTVIRGIGPAMVPKLARLGIRNVAGLLCHYPREWEDRSVPVPIAEFHRAQVNTEVTVLAHDWIGFGRKLTPKVIVEDESARAALLCFNQPWLQKQLEVGKRYRIWGRFNYRHGEIQSGSFEHWQPLPAEPAGILPVYPLSAGLYQKTLRAFIGRALDTYAAGLEDELPAEIIARDNLLSKAAAVRSMHFPASAAELELAKKTLIYEELFYFEIMIGKRAFARKKAGSKNPVSRSPYSPLQQRLLERLPFSLTRGQGEAVAEINADMENGHYSMARLLQGDVGSGKTLVAFLAMLRTVEPAGQAALMAPTELLARQHAETAARLLEPLGLKIAFLTGNIKAAGRKDLLKHLASGEIDIVVGTHALFSKDVCYKNLRLVVVDEQHRFGVTQRSLIMAKGINARGDLPHLLMMSATPIPRTLAMTVYGDMDVTVIRDMPPGRKPVETHLAKESSENRVYDFVRGKLADGSQAYFVYPLIESGDEMNLKDAVSMAGRLADEVFPRFTVALIHSKLDEEVKRQTMERFRSGAIQVLVATSVVEVGVDVPNATCMVVEHAERFGLSALHQLRGRVGRGKAQSYFFMIFSDQEVPPEYAGKKAELLSEEERSREGRRLMVMLKNTDGFVIAEEDLRLRGPGQIAGTEQSGYLKLEIADSVRDAQALEKARADAFFILENDPGLVLDSHRIITRVLEEAPPFNEVAL